VQTAHTFARRWSTIDHRVVDGALALVLLALGLLQAWPRYVPIPERWGRVDWVAYALPSVLAVVAAGAVLLWRRRPRIAVVISVGALLVAELTGSAPETVGIAALLSFYGLGRYGAPRGDGLALLVGGIAVLGGSVVWRTGFDWWLIFEALIFGAVWWIGDAVRDRDERIGAFHEEVARLEAERRREAALAAEAERTRIARELHDVIAHNVSVMVVQAAAANRVLDADPAAARASLATIEQTGREALTEMRRLLGILRADGSALSDPQPSLARLPALVEEMRAAGLPVRLSIEGEAPRLSPGVDLSAYRVAQEALTNVLRHAGPSPTEVALRYRPDAIELEVTDDGSAAPPTDDVIPSAAATEPDVGGHGLAGMRERVALVHGELEAGPRPGGGFRILARLPLVDG
jgi:signal transduction histidine kinase